MSKRDIILWCSSFGHFPWLNVAVMRPLVDHKILLQRKLFYYELPLENSLFSEELIKEAYSFHSH